MKLGISDRAALAGEPNPAVAGPLKILVPDRGCQPICKVSVDGLLK